MLDPHGALICTMVIVSAADRDMTDDELEIIGGIVGHLPAFRAFDRESLPSVLGDCAKLLNREDGLEEAFAAIKKALPANLRETAYAVACDVAAADGEASQEELRVLEMMRHRLDIDRLIAAGIERGARARFQRMTTTRNAGTVAARHSPTRRAVMRLADFKVLSFDCYGTLIDWESGIWAALQPLLAKAGGALAREAALAAFARHESAQQAQTPGLRYADLLALVHRRLGGEWGIAPDADADRTFGASVGDWPAFPDSAPALAYLQGFYQLVILSNVDRASFARSNTRLGVAFAAVYTAEDIGSYKPDPRNFRYVLDRLAASGHRSDDILHVAQSLFHDHVPANGVGLHSAWIDRRADTQGWGATPPPEGDVHYDFRFASLAELAAAHGAERCPG